MIGVKDGGGCGLAVMMVKPEGYQKDIVALFRVQETAVIRPGRSIRISFDIPLRDQGYFPTFRCRQINR